MNSNKHILFLVPGFPKDENDFHCIPPLQEFLKKFISQFPSIKISVISFQYPYHNKFYLWNGINVIPLNGKNSLVKKPFVWLNAIRQIKKIKKLTHIDVIHSLWLGECAFIGNYLSKKFGCRHICTLMGQDVKSENKYLALLKNSKTKFIALSMNQADQFKKLTHKKVVDLIHWGIGDQKNLNLERDIDLIGVGSLIPLKNYKLFIKVITEVTNTYPNIRCKLIGEGPEFSTLRKLAFENGINENIKFTGLLERTEIFKLMQRSKILIHPSKFESFGYVFTEALVNGTNIISFNVGCAQDHPKWFIAKNDEDFVNLTQKTLAEKLIFEPVNLFPLQETVDKYFALYNS